MSSPPPVPDIRPPATDPPVDISMLDSTAEKTPQQMSLRAFLKITLIKLYLRDRNLLDDKELYRYRIRTYPLDLDGEDICRPRCFEPLDFHSLPPATPDYVNHDFAVENLKDPVVSKFLIWHYLEAYLKSLHYLDLPDGQLPFAFLPKDDIRVQDLWDQMNFDCGPHWVTHIEDNSEPHIKCIYWTHYLADNNMFLRAELSLVVKLQLLKLQEEQFGEHAFTPVLAIVIHGSRVRILEAYCQDKALIVRKTRLYGFMKGDYGTFRTIARWFFSDPVADYSVRYKPGMGPSQPQPTPQVITLD